MNKTTAPIFLIFLCLLLALLSLSAATLHRLQLHLNHLDELTSHLLWENNRINDTLIYMMDERRQIEELREFLLSIGFAEFEATAYTLECGYPWNDGYTYTGTKATPGRTIAVDPSVIPLGSRVFIQGRGLYVAEDTGGAIKGNKLDIYMGDGAEAYKAAMEYGRRSERVVWLP